MEERVPYKHKVVVQFCHLLFKRIGYNTAMLELADKCDLGSYG
jgi:hypothetical protein